MEAPDAASRPEERLAGQTWSPASVWNTGFLAPIHQLLDQLDTTVYDPIIK